MQRMETMLFALKHNDSRELKHKAESYFDKMANNQRYTYHRHHLIFYILDF